MMTLKKYLFLAVSALMLVVGSNVEAARARPASKNPLASHKGFMAEQEVFFAQLHAAVTAHQGDDDRTAKAHLKNANNSLSKLKKLGKGRARSVTVWQKAYNEIDDVVAGRAQLNAQEESEIERGEAGEEVGGEEGDVEYAENPLHEGGRPADEILGGGFEEGDVD